MTMTETGTDPWTPYNNGSGKRIWLLKRRYSSEYHYASNGTLIRYATSQTAGKAAAKLNAPAPR